MAAGSAAYGFDMPKLRDIPLRAPPALLRQGPLREGSFPSPLHDERTAALIGRALGIAFATCFVTGLISHYLQHPPGWLPLLSRPVWGYRLSQGIHVATGIASVPLLLAKLWTVYPRLWAWPPATSVLNALERLSIFALVAGALFELATGLTNVAQWYPWAFFFPRAHYLVGWLTVGALLVHIAVKAPVIARALRRSSTSDARADGLSRRGFLTAIGAATGVVTLATVGQAVAPLSGLALLAPRRPTLGPQGLPVNRTAAGARVLTSARDAGYRLVVAGPTPLSLSLADLRALPMTDAALPISCVEGWSAGAHWRGVRLRDLLDRAGIPADATVRVMSLEQHGIYRQTLVQPSYARDPLTLLALELNGAELDIEHGYPVRLIAPNRPGVLQTKWVSRIAVTT